MSMIGLEANPLSVEIIRRFVGDVRLYFGIKDGEVVDVENLIDLVLPSKIPEFFYWLGEEEDVGNNHGQAVPARSEMLLRDDVYHGMLAGDPQHRETVMHEVGHLLLHKPDQIRLNRNPGNRIRTECDPEWQADTFAAEFLAHYSVAITCKTASELAQKAGVPFLVANKQWKLYKEAGLI